VIYETATGRIQAYPGNDYWRLRVDSGTASIEEAVVVAENLLVNGGTLSLGSNTMTVMGNMSVATSAVLSAGTGTVVFSSSADQTLDPGGNDANHAFFNLTKQGGARLSIIGNGLRVTGTAAVSSTADILDLGGLGFTIATLSNAGTFELDGTQSTQIVTTPDIDSGRTLYNGSSGGTVRISGFYDLTIAQTGASFSAGTALTIHRDLDITAGTLSAGSYGITVPGTGPSR
jgi:hypothetical protein